MHFINKYQGFLGCQVGNYLSVVLLHLQGKGIDNPRYQFIGVKVFGLHRHFLFLKHRHLQHLLHLETQALGLVVDDTGDVLEHLWRLADRGILQHLCRQ